jgi:hypothetical protein
VPFLHEVKDRLVAQGVGVYNVNIFIGSASIVPIGDGPYLSLRETGGTGPAKTQNNTGTERPGAQVLTRGTNPDLARAMAAAAFAALGGVDGLYNITLTGVAYISLSVRQSIVDIGKDDTGKRTMYSFNIDAEKYPS